MRASRARHRPARSRGSLVHLAYGRRRPLDAAARPRRFDLRSASALPTSVRCVDRAAQSRRQISRGPSRWGAGCPRGVRECNNNAAFFFARNLPAVAETSEAQGGFANSVPTRLTDTSLQKSATTGSLFFLIFHNLHIFAALQQTCFGQNYE